MRYIVILFLLLSLLSACSKRNDCNTFTVRTDTMRGIRYGDFNEWLTPDSTYTFIHNGGELIYTKPAPYILSNGGKLTPKPCDVILFD